jgi:hypothetical protein
MLPLHIRDQRTSSLGWFQRAALRPTLGSVAAARWTIPPRAIDVEDGAGGIAHVGASPGGSTRDTARP